MKKKIYKVLWNHLKMLRPFVGRHIFVECVKCKDSVTGHKDIEEWLIKWKLCDKCADAYMTTSLEKGDAERLLSPHYFPFIDLGNLARVGVTND